MGSAPRGCGDERCVAGDQQDRGRLRAEAAVGVAAAAAAAAAAAVDPWWRFVGVGRRRAVEAEHGRSVRSMGARQVRNRLVCVCARARLQAAVDGSRVSSLLARDLGLFVAWCALVDGSWFLFGAGCFCGAVLLCCVFWALAGSCWEDLEPKGVNERSKKANMGKVGCRGRWVEA